MLQATVLLLLGHPGEETLAREKKLSNVAPNIQDSIAAVRLHLLGILDLTVLAVLRRADMCHPGHTGHTLDSRRSFLSLNLGKPILEKTLRIQLSTEDMRLLRKCSKELLLKLWLGPKIR